MIASSGFHLLYLDTVKNYPTWVVALAFCIPFVGGLILYFYKTRHARSWRKGIYPPKLKLTEDNLLEAYLALGSLLVLIDYSSSKSKTKFINSYFNRFFVRANYNFGDSLLFSLRYPIKIDSVCSWLTLHLKTEGERSQVIYFLAGIAMMDKKMTQRELHFLDVVNQKLDLPKQNLERIISMYKEYQSNSDQRQNESQQRKKTTSLRSSFEEKRFAEILHLSATPNLAELKGNYRKLAKEHHPDVFAQASEAQQRLAQASFQEIQAAYEFWLKKLTP